MNSDVRNVLIIKTSSLGDIIHAYPAIDFIHKMYPQANIDWVVETPNADIVATHPYINRAILISTKSWRKDPFSKKTFAEIKTSRSQLRDTVYDVAFDLQGNMKSGMILSQVRAKHKVGFGSETVPEWPNLLFTNKKYNPPSGQNIRNDYLSLVRDYFGGVVGPERDNGVTLKISNEDRAVLEEILRDKTLNAKMKVMVCPGSAWPNKQLTLETLRQFLVLMEKEFGCAFIFAWGSLEELDTANILHQHFPISSVVIDRMKLPMLQNLMGECDLVVAMDSLPLHLAGTTKTATYSVFGASSAAKYNPVGPRHGALQGSCPYGRTFVKRCPILRTCPTGACIHDLKAQDIFDDYLKFYSLNNP